MTCGYPESLEYWKLRASDCLSYWFMSQSENNEHLPVSPADTTHQISNKFCSQYYHFYTLHITTNQTISKGISATITMAIPRLALLSLMPTLTKKAISKVLLPKILSRLTKPQTLLNLGPALQARLNIPTSLQYPFQASRQITNTSVWRQPTLHVNSIQRIKSTTFTPPSRNFSSSTSARQPIRTQKLPGAKYRVYNEGEDSKPCPSWKRLAWGIGTTSVAFFVTKAVLRGLIIGADRQIDQEAWEERSFQEKLWEARTNLDIRGELVCQGTIDAFRGSETLVLLAICHYGGQWWKVIARGLVKRYLYIPGLLVV